MREHAYWQLSLRETSMSLDEATEELRAALDRATRLRLVRADVPVGCYVSGGLDSSVIATLAGGGRGRVQTYSLRFSRAEYDEGEFQRLVVDRLGSDHRELAVSRGAIANAFPEVIRHTERPILRTAPAPLLLLSRLVRESNLKVVLTGEGADEMLAGYDL